MRESIHDRPPHTLPAAQPASAEQLRQLSLLRLVDAGLGHELRNLVMPVLLRLDALGANEVLSAKARQDLLEIRESILHLKQLANGLQLLSVDPQAREFDTLVTHLPEWWIHMQPIVTNSLPARAFITADIPLDLPLALMPAPVLAQTLMNLVADYRADMQSLPYPRMHLDARVEHGAIRLTITGVRPSQIPHHTSAPRPHPIASEADNTVTDDRRHGDSRLGPCAAKALLHRYGGTLTEEAGGDAPPAIVIRMPAAPSDDPWLRS